MIISYLGTSIQVVTDWTCAITPFFIVRDLQMQRRVKISVICVLGLGVFASFAAMMRIVFYQYVDTRNYPDDELCKAISYERSHHPIANLFALS